MTIGSPIDATELWRRVFGAGAGFADPAAAHRLGELLSPALAHHLLILSETSLGRALWNPDLLRASQLANRFARGQQLAWARVIAEAGIPVVYLKGFAAAHSLYADPDVRVIGDLDVLVRARDIGRLVKVLGGHGFRFSSASRRPWGVIADASFAPFVSRDGHCNIDIHSQPDSYPAHLSLGAETVFDASVEVMAGELPIRIPCREHVLLLAVTNAAKDKFGPFSVRQIADAAVVLRDGPALDWRYIEDIARRGGFIRQVNVLSALLVGLGLPAERVPDPFARPPEGIRGREFARLLDAWRGLFPEIPTLWATLRRELLLCAEPATGFRRNLARLKGLIWPRDGVLGRTAFI